MCVKEILFERVHAEQVATHMSQDEYTNEEIALQVERYRSLWQVLEETNLVNEYCAWEERKESQQ